MIGYGIFAGLVAIAIAAVVLGSERVDAALADVGTDDDTMAIADAVQEFTTDEITALRELAAQDGQQAHRVAPRRWDR